MIIRISQLKLHPDHSVADLEREIRKTLHLKGEKMCFEIMRRSVDARKKPELFYVYTVDVTVNWPKQVIKRIKNKNVALVSKADYVFPMPENRSTVPDITAGNTARYTHTVPDVTKGAVIRDNLQISDCSTGDIASELQLYSDCSADEGVPDSQLISAVTADRRSRPVIVGSGPAGLFCALMLARAGLRPIVLERGERVEERLRSVEEFWQTGRLDPQSNVQFGEGGAGTFSDGKLNTLIKDPTGRIRFVLKEFVSAGASPSILYDYKPHIGTDVLAQVIRHIREEICSLGGEFRFRSCLTDITARLAPAASTATSYLLSINHGESELIADVVVLAIGHSARDTFEMLNGLGLPMQPKPFAVGFRMEHSQQVINEAMYGADCPYDLGAAPYKVTHKCRNGRGVYSFCMCPGGYVVNASSEPGRLAVNGMSYSTRSSHNANSAIVVTITPGDYNADGPLSGIAFQRKLEEAAWACADGDIPVQRFGDFCENRPSDAPGNLLPQCKGAFRMTNLRPILPDYLNESIIEGIHAFGRSISGFDDPDALLSGVESRTSSPVRILRDETSLQSAFPGIYPCGEGAGYAGGITSAAIDGIRIAEAILNKYILQ